VSTVDQRPRARQNGFTPAAPAGGAAHGAAPPEPIEYPAVREPSALTEEECRRVGRLLYQQSRIAVHRGKEQLVRFRLARSLRRLGLDSFTAYLDHVEADASGAELAMMIDLLTTNKTSFFREAAHFEYLSQEVIPELVASGESIRIWSAGCSTGEEPFTLAMLLHAALPRIESHDVRILATDISARVLATAREALYPRITIREIPPRFARTYLVPVSDDRGVSYRVRDDVRRLVYFARLNLMAAWPMRQSFQVIFCRNVLMYFDRETQERLVQRFWDALAPGGRLFIGHSEVLTSLDHRFRYVRPAVYVK
jgi:chemotaxis protein methyltransferase CheR